MARPDEPLRDDAPLIGVGLEAYEPSISASVPQPLRIHHGGSVKVCRHRELDAVWEFPPTTRARR